jgi:hypothetical protein
MIDLTPINDFERFDIGKTWSTYNLSGILDDKTMITVESMHHSKDTSRAVSAPIAIRVNAKDMIKWIRLSPDLAEAIASELLVAAEYVRSIRD